MRGELSRRDAISSSLPEPRADRLELPPRAFRPHERAARLLRLALEVVELGEDVAQLRLRLDPGAGALLGAVPHPCGVLTELAPLEDQLLHRLVVAVHEPSEDLAHRRALGGIAP